MQLRDGEEVLTAAYLGTGMPYVELTDLLHIPNTCHDGGDKPDEVH